VGKSGTLGRRFKLVTASARSRPALTCGSVVIAVLNMT
jgi:hypothetical protein